MNDHIVFATMCESGAEPDHPLLATIRGESNEVDAREFCRIEGRCALNPPWLDVCLGETYRSQFPLLSLETGGAWISIGKSEEVLNPSDGWIDCWVSSSSKSRIYITVVNGECVAYKGWLELSEEAGFL